MDLTRIAARLAALPPLPQVKLWAEELLKEEDEPELQDILQAIIEAADAKKSKAYLLVEDFKDISSEYGYEPPQELKRLMARTTR